MFNLPYFNRDKFLLVFEYGLTIQRVASEHNIELTPEIIKRAERILESEFRSQRATFLATNMVPIILSIFEIDITR